jgi:hypothetical protein
MVLEWAFHWFPIGSWDIDIMSSQPARNRNIAKANYVLIVVRYRAESVTKRRRYIDKFIFFFVRQFFVISRGLSQPPGDSAPLLRFITYLISRWLGTFPLFALSDTLEGEREARERDLVSGRPETIDTDLSAFGAGGTSCSGVSNGSL